VKIELPAETGVFKPAPGVEIANAQCLICHSVEYVETQPWMPRAFWAASVKKMREKYGSAILEEQVEPLLDYLARHYGTETNSAPSFSANAASKSVPPGPLTGETVATKYGCLGCHNVSVKIVGPPYKDIAAKYRNDADAFNKVAGQIQKGGSGKWGPVIMPPFPMVTEAETKLLVEWILGQK
jgi:cytochrome c551/c552